jgi:hypothetical protein
MALMQRFTLSLTEVETLPLWQINLLLEQIASEQKTRKETDKTPSGSVRVV